MYAGKDLKMTFISDLKKKSKRIHRKNRDREICLQAAKKNRDRDREMTFSKIEIEIEK